MIKFGYVSTILILIVALVIAFKAPANYYDHKLEICIKNSIKHNINLKGVASLPEVTVLCQGVISGKSHN